jgi:hypothetical protein
LIEVLRPDGGPPPARDAGPAAFSPFDHAGWVAAPVDGGCAQTRAATQVGVGGDVRLCVDAPAGDVAWSYAPEHVHVILATVGLAYVPSLRRAGAMVALQPVMRRPFDGGFAYGLAISFLDAGPDFRRATLAVALEYDFSWFWRESADGADRPLQLVLGVESGLSVRTQDTEFGQVVALGVALDPFLEARIRLDPHLRIVVRGSAIFALDRIATAALVFQPGLVIEW